MQYNYWGKLSRSNGKFVGILYASYIKEKDPMTPYEKWINIISIELFGCEEKTRKERLKKNQANPNIIGKNYIPLALSDEAIAHCQRLVIYLDFKNLEETHKKAIRLTKEKYSELN